MMYLCGKREKRNERIEKTSFTTQTQLVMNSLYIPRWSQTYEPPTSASLELNLLASTNMSAETV